MAARLIRDFLMGVLFLSVIGLVACGDEDKKKGGTLQTECTESWECSGDQMCHEGQCVPDTTPWCESKFDCDDGEYCRGGICTAEGESCSGDKTCGKGRICDEGACVEGCRSSSECSDNLACLDDNTCGACTSNNQCAKDDICDEGVCVNPDKGQCQGLSAGRACDPEGLIAAGNKCEDFGRGHVCVPTCVAAPSSEPDPCQSGSFCDARAGEEGVCRISECKDPTDVAGCDDLVAANPEDFKDGVSCQYKRNQTFLCESVRRGGAEGDSCSSLLRCGGGLTCGPHGTCQPFCAEDADCPGTMGCVGEDTGGTTGIPGWGVCAEDACKSFGDPDQCGEGGACKALTPKDGVCVYSEGTTPAYGACNSPSECVAGTECLALSAGQARCYPSCDPTRELQSAADATCPGGNLVSFARFVHLAGDIGPVDIYVDGERVLEAHEVDSATAGSVSRAYMDLEPGVSTIDVTAPNSSSNQSPLASISSKLSGNRQASFVLVESDAGLKILEQVAPRGVSQPAAGSAKVRFSMDVDLGFDVDLYISEVGDDELTALVKDLSFGDMSDFDDSLSGGANDLHIFKAGADHKEDDAEYVLEISTRAEAVGTLHIWGEFDGGSELSGVGATNVIHVEAVRTFAGGSCVELNFGPNVPSFESGVCFQKCPGTDVGDDACVADGDTCTMFRSDYSCLPSQKNQVGESCSLSALNPCEGGAYCREKGDGTGVCASNCVPEGSDDPLLQCAAGESCMPVEGTPLGECGFACAPKADYSSGDCTDPALGACVELQRGEQAFCSASGTTAVGEACPDVTINSCAPNAVCRREPDDFGINGVIIDPVSPAESGNDNAVCRQRCELFEDESGCPDGEACMIDATHLSTVAGFCQPEEASLNDLKSLDECPDEHRGKMCGDGSICVRDGEGSICLQFCELGTNRGCKQDEEVCRRLFGSGVDIGYCIPD